MLAAIVASHTNKNHTKHPRWLEKKERKFCSKFVKNLVGKSKLNQMKNRL